MRFKGLLDFFPAPRRAIKHAYSAITLTRYTTLYFAALLLSTITLASLELSSHVTNRHADVTLSTIMHLASVQSNLIPIVSNQDGQGVLQLCNGIPSGSQDERCQTVVAPTPVGGQTQLPANVGSSPSTTRQSSTAGPTTPTQVPQEAQGPVSTTAASTSSSTSTDNPGLFFVEEPTSTSSSSVSASATGLVVAEIPETTTSSTTTSTHGSESTTTVSTSNTAVNAKATTQPSTETTTTTESDKGRTDTTSTSFSTVETTGSTSSQVETETQSNNQSETTQTTTSEVTSSTTSSAKVKETKTTSSVTQSTSSSSFESATSTTSNDKTSTLPTSTREPSSTSTSTSGDAGIADVSLSEPNPTSSLPTATPTLQTSTATKTKAEITTSVESRPTEASTTLVSDSTTSSASASASASASSERPTDQSRSRAVLQDRMILRRSFEAVPVTNTTTGAILGLNVTDIGGNGSNDVTFVDVLCAQALILVEEQLHESWTEDLVMVGYHIWLFGLGAMAILNESIPHLVAAFISSVLALIWSGAQIAETRDFHNQFNTFITNGACDGADILPTYWLQRSKIDVAIFVLNSITLLALGGLGSKLISVYRRQMTKVVGEEQGIMRRLYKAVLLLSIVIQIGAFLLLASLALWVQQLFTSPIASFSSTTPAFKGVGLLSILLTIPWFVIGWVAIRREHKILMVVFLVMNGLFLAGWVAVFSSDVYRLVFTKWTFFAAVTVATFFLLVGSLIAGVLCRMHFGMGLAIQLEEKAKDEVDVTPWEFSDTAEKAWEPFERSSIRQSQFTAISSDRQSTAFSYGLKSPAPPVPPRRPTNLSRFSNVTD